MTDALEAREEKLVHYYNEELEKERYTFWMSIDLLKNFGGGVYLFFDYSKKLAIVFTIVGLVSIAKCVLIYKANGFEKSD